MKPTSETPTTPPATAQDPQHHRDGEEPMVFLEPTQLASERSVPVPPAQLSERARAGLWFLRIFALVVSFMVIYTFVAQLH